MCFLIVPRRKTNRPRHRQPTPATFRWKLIVVGFHTDRNAKLFAIEHNRKRPTIRGKMFRKIHKKNPSNFKTRQFRRDKRSQSIRKWVENEKRQPTDRRQSTNLKTTRFLKHRQRTNRQLDLLYFLHVNCHYIISHLIFF